MQNPLQPRIDRTCVPKPVPEFPRRLLRAPDGLFLPIVAININNFYFITSLIYENSAVALVNPKTIYFEIPRF